MFRFANPHLLWLLLLVPMMIIAFAILLRLRKRNLRRFGNVEVVKSLLRDVSSWRVHAKFILFVTAFSALVLAAARPQFGAKLREEKSEGVLSQDTQEIPVCPDPFDYITALLVRLGAPTSQQGFRFLRRGVMLMMADPAQQLTKVLYPALAAEFDTSPANVEKALRTTVTTAWTRRRDEVWRNYFPLTPAGQIPRPTAGQFLSRLADATASMNRRQA